MDGLVRVQPSWTGFDDVVLTEAEGPLEWDEAAGAFAAVLVVDAIVVLLAGLAFGLKGAACGLTTQCALTPHAASELAPWIALAIFAGCAALTVAAVWWRWHRAAGLVLLEQCLAVVGLTATAISTIT